MTDLPLVVGDAILLGIVVIVAVVVIILELILAPDDVDGSDTVVVIDVGIDADGLLDVVLVDRSGARHVIHP